MKTYTYNTTPEAVILAAMGDKPYPMSLVGNDAAAVVAAVNQGIDAHLQGITASSFQWTQTPYVRRLVCEVSPADMCVLLRRLSEAEDDASMDLRYSILSTLEIDEV